MPRRMFPYVQKHEFEGLLFSDTNAFRAVALAAEQDIEALSKNPPTIQDARRYQRRSGRCAEQTNL